MKHEFAIVLDPQKGGWLASCDCGWQMKRTTFYRRNAVRLAREHVEDATKP